MITEYVLVPVRTGQHEETALLFLTKLADATPVILGLPWLQRHNPSVDWTAMTLTFNSRYCQTNCLPWTLKSTPAETTPGSKIPPLSLTSIGPLPTYRAPPEKDEMEVPSSQPSSWKDWTCASAQHAHVTSQHTHVARDGNVRRVRHQQPYVTDEPEQRWVQLDAPPMSIDATLTPELDHFRTRRVHSLTATETRARMIRPPPLKHVPVQRTAGCFRPVRRPPPLKPMPPLSVPIPPIPNDTTPDRTLRPDLSNIRMANATSFLQFCKEDGVRCCKMTWNELDIVRKGQEKVSRPAECPDLPEQLFHDILLGRLPREAIRHFFSEDYQDYLDELSSPLHLDRITEADVDKFMKGKPKKTDEEIRQQIPEWLRHWTVAFLPRLAEELPPHRSWDLKIDLIPGREPPYIKNRPLNASELLVVSKWLDDNLSKGFIRESRSRCAAPLMLAAKPGGGVRICQDYRGLNNVTIKNRYPIPLIRETLEQLMGAKIYTKLDIIAAFNKLRIAEGEEWKTAFITRRGLYETLVMPFGLTNAPAQFQHYINHTLGDLLDKICTAYLDDVLVYSTDRKEHRQHVEEVVKRLHDAGLQIDIDKCEFETTKVKYLGLMITPNGIEMDPEKVSTILRWGDPPGLKDLQKFLGFANFYRRFIKDYSKICAPLHKLLSREHAWHWGPEQAEAFAKLKLAFTSRPVLAYFDFNRRTVLETDASDWASGGVLSQYDDEGMLRPVAYFSSKHTAAECNYEIYDKELLAIIKALEEWRPELQGSREPFEVVTDHKNLQYFMTTKALNQRQVRWSEFLAGFDFRIVYRPGKMAVRPDALSRKPDDRPRKSDPDDDRIKHRERIVLPADRWSEEIAQDLHDLLKDPGLLSLAPIDAVQPAEDRPIDELIDVAYQGDPIVQTMVTALRDEHARQWPAPIRKHLKIAFGDCSLINGRVYWRDRLYVPDHDELKTQIMYRSHNSALAGHPGRTKTIDLIQRSYWWPRLTQEVAAYVKACELCVRTKSPRSSPAGFLQPLPVPFRAWSDISVDYITPLPKSEHHGQTFQHIVVVVCRLTKMRHFIPTVGLTAEELADSFLSRIYCLHGSPDNIISDRGSQFVSEFWKHFSERLGVTLKHSSAFHPETDGQTERLNAVLEQYLRAFVSFSQDDWAKWLPLAEFSSNNAVSETTGVSPFYANYGFNPRMGVEPSLPCRPGMTTQRKQEFFYANAVAERFEAILDWLKALARQAIARYEENANIHRADAPIYHVGQRVYVNIKNMKSNRPARKLDDKWAGPFVVTKVYRRACLLQLPATMGRIFPVFHTSLLRPASEGRPRPGQDRINEIESRRTRGRILERDDDTLELVEKWEFEGIEDCHNESGLHYLVKWKGHAPSWQPASDLKGSDEVILQYHAMNPDKPAPPPWVRRPAPAAQNPAPVPAPVPQPVLRRSARLRGLILKTVRFSSIVQVAPHFFWWD